MEGEVVVVFYGLEGDFFAEEAEMVDWDGDREESVKCWGGLVFSWGFIVGLGLLGLRDCYLPPCPVQSGG